ncbi:MAG: anti-sigma factor family protein [Candidatus Binatia bacterium]
MLCREFTNLLMDYFSATLPMTRRARFAEHRAGCKDCAAYLKSYQQTVKLSKAAFLSPDDFVSVEVPEELVQVILAARPRRGLSVPAAR